MQAGMENIMVRLSSAEEDLACAKSSAAVRYTVLSQVVPLAEMQLLQTKLDKLQQQTAKAASADTAKAAAVALEQQKVIERLNQMLTMQQEECLKLQTRLQVWVIETIVT